MPSLDPSYQPTYVSDREESSFSPYEHKCAHSGGWFQEHEMVLVNFDWVSRMWLNEYLIELEANVLPCEYEEIIKNIK